MAAAILFRGKPDDPKTFEEVVYQALGAASACWENPFGAGVFESTQCRQIGEELMQYLRDRETDVKAEAWDEGAAAAFQEPWDGRASNPYRSGAVS